MYFRIKAHNTLQFVAKVLCLQGHQPWQCWALVGYHQSDPQTSWGHLGSQPRSKMLGFVTTRQSGDSHSSISNLPSQCITCARLETIFAYFCYALQRQWCAAVTEAHQLEGNGALARSWRRKHPATRLLPKAETEHILSNMICTLQGSFLDFSW